MRPLSLHLPSVIILTAILQPHISLAIRQMEVRPPVANFHLRHAQRPDTVMEVPALCIVVDALINHGVRCHVQVDVAMVCDQFNVKRKGTRADMMI